MGTQQLLERTSFEQKDEKMARDTLEKFFIWVIRFYFKSPMLDSKILFDHELTGAFGLNDILEFCMKRLRQPYPDTATFMPKDALEDCLRFLRQFCHNGLSSDWSDVLEDCLRWIRLTSVTFTPTQKQKLDEWSSKMAQSHSSASTSSPENVWSELLNWVGASFYNTPDFPPRHALKYCLTRSAHRSKLRAYKPTDILEDCLSRIRRSKTVNSRSESALVFWTKEMTRSYSETSTTSNLKLILEYLIQRMKQPVSQPGSDSSTPSPETL